MCRLIRYLAAHTLNNPGVPLKEYQIATEVFGRPAGFDPRMDSTVRVQTGRLRAKLAEYYSGKGADDPVVVELPKGNYTLLTHERTLIEAPPPPTPIRQPEPLSKVPANTWLSGLVVSVWSLGAIALVLSIALIVALTRPPALRSVAQASPAVRTFWHGFVDQPERPLVVFSNAAFIGRPETGMRYYDARQDSPTAILDHYTGVGEVIAIHDLDQLFASLDHSIRVKRGRLMSLDDAKNNDVIFVGSPSENLSLREMATTQDFVFHIAESGPRKGDLEIVNLKPKTGESLSFQGSAAVPITEDYALVGMVHGIISNRWVLVLAGTTTIGTQAAVETVTRGSSVEDLVSRVGVKDGAVRAFEAVIRVKVSGGVPVNSEIVALHPRS